MVARDIGKCVHQVSGEWIRELSSRLHVDSIAMEFIICHQTPQLCSPKTYQRLYGVHGVAGAVVEQGGRPPPVTVAVPHRTTSSACKSEGVINRRRCF